MKMTIWETFQVKVEKNWEKPSFADSDTELRNVCIFQHKLRQLTFDRRSLKKLSWVK